MEIDGVKRLGHRRRQPPDGVEGPVAQAEGDHRAARRRRRRGRRARARRRSAGRASAGSSRKPVAPRHRRVLRRQPRAVPHRLGEAVAAGEPRADAAPAPRRTAGGSCVEAERCLDVGDREQRGRGGNCRVEERQRGGRRRVGRRIVPKAVDGGGRRESEGVACFAQRTARAGRDLDRGRARCPRRGGSGRQTSPSPPSGWQRRSRSRSASFSAGGSSPRSPIASASASASAK